MSGLLWVVLAALASTVVAALASTVVVLWVRLDRMRAMFSNQRFYLAAHLAKALRDRRSSVVIDAGALAKAFALDERTLPKDDEFDGKPGPHPATLKPARRVKL